MAQELSLAQIEEHLTNLPGWSYEKNSITKEFLFEDFSEAMGFMVRVGIEAEKAVHHPELFNVYNKVIVTLKTHDIGDKVSEKDVQLATNIEALVD